MEGKKAFIESPHFADVAGPCNERGPTCPEDFARCVILAYVSFDLVKNPPAAERVPIPVNQPARRASIVEIAGVPCRQELRLTNRNSLVARKGLEQGHLPVRRHKGIVVQECDTGGVDLRKPTVARRRETGIASEWNKSDIWELVPNPFVVTPILHDDGGQAAW